MSGTDLSLADGPAAKRLLQRGELLKKLWDLMHDAAGGGRHAFIHLKLGGTRSIFGDGSEGEPPAILDCLTRAHDAELAWLGGDEFCLLLGHCGLDEARRFAGRVHQEILARRPVSGGGDGTPEPGIDIVSFGPGSQNLAVLLAAAGLAGPSAKHGSGIRKMVFS